MELGGLKAPKSQKRKVICTAAICLKCKNESNSLKVSLAKEPFREKRDGDRDRGLDGENFLYR